MMPNMDVTMRARIQKKFKVKIMPNKKNTVNEYLDVDKWSTYSKMILLGRNFFLKISILLFSYNYFTKKMISNPFFVCRFYKSYC